MEQRILKIAPGYTLIKETAKQFLGNRPSPFSEVAICTVDGSERRVTAFVTEKHSDGGYSVFVPTAPSPMSGAVYHLPGKWVTIVDISVEQVMQTFISCGAGSEKVMELYRQVQAEQAEGVS